jgi:serine/threonine protein phosphatase PrpC
LLKHRLPFNIESQLKVSLQGLGDQYPNFDTLNASLTKAFADTNKEVYAMVSDVRFSGSTCVSVLTFGRRVYVANVGDSRAILIR